MGQDVSDEDAERWSRELNRVGARIATRFGRPEVPASWVADDEVYGSDDKFRRCCEQLRLGDVGVVSSAPLSF